MNHLFITVEGGEGAGKTTVLQKLFEQLTERGYDVLLSREPGGISISEKIRNIILDVEHTEMDERTEALLYAAARRQHLVEKIEPALKQGKIVLCDRFIDSSLAYQGYARQIGMENVFQINQFAIEGFMPSLTLFFDIKPEDGLRRIQLNNNREKNRLDLETLKFHYKVYEAYQILLEQFPQRIKRVNANQEIHKVMEDAFQIILNHLTKKE